MDSQSAKQDIPTQPIDPAIQESKKNTPAYWIIILIISCIIFSAIGYLIFKNTFSQPVNPGPAISTNQSMELPINPDRADIISYGVFYFIEGQVTGVENTSEGLNVKTNIPDLTSLILTDRALVHYFTSDQKYVETTKQSLQTGQNIRVSVTYDERRDERIVKGLLILVDQAPATEESSESGELNN